jgi:hypothetical protein
MQGVSATSKSICLLLGKKGKPSVARSRSALDLGEGGWWLAPDFGHKKTALAAVDFPFREYWIVVAYHTYFRKSSRNWLFNSSLIKSSYRTRKLRDDCLGSVRMVVIGAFSTSTIECLTHLMRPVRYVAD